MDESKDRPGGASGQCPHSDLHFHLNNAHFGNTNLHYLEITARCKICDVDMQFCGLPLGMNPRRPTTSADCKTAILPFLGEGEEMTGAAPGYSIRVEGR